MTPDRILFIGALKFCFHGLLAHHRGPVSEANRRAYWAIAKERATEYCARIEADWCRLVV